MPTRPSLARALADAVQALPARERAAFDRLLAEDLPAAPPARHARARTAPTGEALTRAAIDELHAGGGHRVASLSDLLSNA